MKILFIGTVQFSKEALLQSIKSSAEVVGVCTLSGSSFNSDYCDLSPVAENNEIPVHYVKDINSSETLNWIKDKKPDVIFCFGWSRLLKKEILNVAPMGVVGFHPALLPQNRGRHPIIWALALGLSETGSTFFFMDKGADSGDILSQEKIRILPEDNAGSLYHKIIDTALGQIKKFIPMLITGNFERLKQSHSKSNYWRKRGIDDGKIDWRMNAETVHNLVRALSKPYVGAHFSYKEKTFKVWESCIVKEKFAVNLEPGKILQKSSNRMIIKCGTDALSLLSFDDSNHFSEGIYL
jgi:methionyl-tRNA formyltransferase